MKKKSLVVFIALVLLSSLPGLYLLDRYDIPSKVRVKSRIYAKTLSLIIRPIKISDEQYFNAVLPSSIQGQVAGSGITQWHTLLQARRQARAGTLFINSDSPAKFYENLRQDLPNVAEEIVGSAERYASGSFTPFNTPSQVIGRDFSWTSYPVFDDDVIYIWEVNTLQHLPILAQAYLLTHESRYLEAIENQLQSWIEENPIDNSVNWIAAMEVSIRLCALISVDKMLLHEDDFKDFYPTLQKLIYAHFLHVVKYIDNPRRANNHGIFSAMGLYFFTVNYPEFRESLRWKEFSERRMLEELDRQYTANGVHKELAPTYHNALLDVYLHYLVIKKISNEPVAGPVLEHIKKQLSFLAVMTNPDGRVFLIGDSDDHHFVRFAETDYADSSPILMLGALLFGDNRFVANTSQARWRCRLLLGESLYNELSLHLTAGDRTANHKESGELQLYKEEGYFRVDSDGLLLLGDFTPTGMERHFSGHNHSDLTSFLLWKDGKPITLDGGTYTYRRSHLLNGVNWRDHLRSSYAHNTAVIDGKSHAQAVEGDFGYENYPAAGILFAGSDRGFNVIAGQHNAYQDAVGRSIRLFITYDRYVTVIDWFPDIREKHRLDTNFLLDSQSLDITGNAASFSGGILTWAEQPEARPLTSFGVNTPPRGWYSDAYGTLRPTSQLQLQCDLEAYSSFGVLLALSESPLVSDAPRPRLRSVQQGELTEYRFTTGVGDIVVLLRQGGKEKTQHPGRQTSATDAEIAVIEAGGMHRAYLFKGLSAEVDGRRYTSLPLLK